MRLRRALHSIIHRPRPPEPKPLILIYHRIADEPVDPWGLAVPPARFEEQLVVLRRTRHILALTDFVHHLITGTLPAHSVAVTFDDGYADNFMAAKPRLTAADVPATVFLITGYLDRPGQFWWDELANLVFLGDCPEKLELTVGEHTRHFDLGTRLELTENGTSVALSARRSKRQRGYLALWRVLRRLDDETRQAMMSKLRRALACANPHAASARAMTRNEAVMLASDGLITIGAHTITHPVLTELGAASRRHEIMDSKCACEVLSGSRALGFSYPYGELNCEVRSDVESADFAYACSTKSGPVTGVSDVLALPRVHILAWDGDGFERALRSASARKSWVEDFLPARSKPG